MFDNPIEATQIAVPLLQIKVSMSPQPWRAGITAQLVLTAASLKRRANGRPLLPDHDQRVDAVGHATPLRIVVSLEMPGFAGG